MNDNLGEYFELEQTYVKGVSSSSFNQLKFETSIQKTKNTAQLCENCKQEVSILLRICPNCGSKMKSCEICKRGFYESDGETLCPKCKNLFHYKHFFEVVKATGTCPVCKERVREAEIV